MNKIDILAPRWKDRTVLVADWKIGLRNQINITCARVDGTRQFPEPFEVSGKWLRGYPTTLIHGRPMRAVPLDALEALKAGPVPNPGSDKAVDQGCTCPVLDNGRGNDELGKSRGFWIKQGCPLHDKS